MPLNAPCAGGVTIENVNGSPSASLPIKVIGTGRFMTSEMLRSLAAGAVLGFCVTSIDIVAVLLSTVPSFALYVKLSGPR